jgi:3-hydroxyacyl-CoA dehydrogenase
MFQLHSSPFGPFALAQSIGYNILLAKLEELYSKFKLEIFKPTELMKKGDIKV